MENKFIIGIGRGEHEYKIGDVTYIVTSHFAKPTDAGKLTIADRMKSFVGGNFADLTADIDADTINGEYVCSAAGKEDSCSRKEKN